MLRVSSKLLSAGLTQAIIKVLLFPPRESAKKKKKALESLFPPKPLSLLGSPRKRKKSEREQECNTEAQPVVFAIRFIHRNFCIAIALIGYMYLRYIYNWRVFKHFMCFNNRKRAQYKTKMVLRHTVTQYRVHFFTLKKTGQLGVSVRNVCVRFPQLITKRTDNVT